MSNGSEIASQAFDVPMENDCFVVNSAAALSLKNKGFRFNYPEVSPCTHTNHSRHEEPLSLKTFAAGRGIGRWDTTQSFWKLLPSDHDS